MPAGRADPGTEMVTAQVLGVDVAWPTGPGRPTPAQIAAAGYQFMIGYLSADPSKNWTPAVLAAARGAGLAAGAVWETTAGRATQGEGAGRLDGAAANAQATALGWPALPIFYAVDEETSLQAVAPYFAGVGATSARPVGAYGSQLVVEGLLNAGRVVVGWQTSAWSDGQVSSNPRVVLYQRQDPTRPIPGATAGTWDEDLLLAPSLAAAGLWTPGPALALAPPQPSEADVSCTFIAREHDTSTGVDDGRWYECNLEAGTKRYVPNQAVANGLAFGGIHAASPAGLPFEWPTSLMSWLQDITVGGSPPPEPL